MPKLLLKFNAAVIKEIPIDKASIGVGRKADNDVVIDNPAISGHHCKISLQGGTYVVEDLDSTNGTFVNEKKIKKSGLHHNDVVGVAKHTLVFIEDAPPPPPPAAAEEAAKPDATMVITPAKQAELVAASAAAAKTDNQKIAYVRVLKGGVGQQTEFELKGMSTYIGGSDRVQIQIKSAGFFGGAPDLAATIVRKPDGYYLNAVEAGYPSVNGAKVTGNLLLKEGDLIECGGTTMQFGLREPTSGTAVTG